MDKKIYALYDGGGDITKRWYVHTKLADGKRKLFYGDLAQYKTLPLRQAAAKRLLLSLQTDFQPNAVLLPDDTIESVSNYIESQKRTWRYKTYLSWRCKWRKFKEFAGGACYNDALVEAFFAQLRNKLHAKTYNDYIQTFGLLLRAVDKEMPKIAKLKKVNSTPAKYFSPAQVRFLAAEINGQNPELWLFVQFVFYCFIRPGELRLLKFGDISVEEKNILVRSEISKNKKEQYISIPTAFLPILEAYTLGKNPTHFVFGIGQRPRRKDYYSRIHQAILKDLGVNIVRHKLYSWKHTGAVMAVKAGIHIKQLQIQLRHSSLEQTDIYLRQMGVTDLGDLADKFPKI